MLQFSIDDLLAHGVTNTVSVDEDVFGQVAIVVLSVALEGAAEVVSENLGADDLLTFLRLRTGLSVVLTKVTVIGCTETNRTLSAFVTYINTNKHGLGRDFFAEVHAPQVTSNLSIHLANDVEEDTVVILDDGTVGNKLGDDGTVTVDLVLDYPVEFLMIALVRHNDHENKLERNTALDRFILGNGLKIFSNNVIIISLNLTCESCKQLVLVLEGLVVDCDNLSELDVDVQMF